MTVARRDAHARDTYKASVRAGRLRKIGAALFWTGMIGSGLVFSVQSILPPWGPLACVALLVAAAVLGVAMVRRGRQLVARPGGQYLAGDPRPPVVYLRPFAADAQGAGLLGSWLLLRPAYFTEEEQLATVLNEIGPFVAIGDPRESLPDLGAARIYTGDHQWQPTVSDLLSRAALVILRPGTSDGFWWEFHLVRETVEPDRLLLLVPADRAVYEAFRHKADEILPHPLPEFPRGKRIMGRTRGILAFESNWRAWALPTVSSFSRTSFTSPYLARLKLTLKPVFARLGVEWSEPPIARKRMVALSTSGVIGTLAFLLWIAFVVPEYLYTPPADLSIPTSSAATVAAPDPYDAAVQRLTARTAELPGFRNAVANAHEPAAARAIGRDLSAKGLRRLSDDLLIRRTGLLSRILSEADAQTCGAIVRGDMGPGQAKVLRRLSPEEIDQWFDFSFESMAAELRQEPVPAGPSQAEIDRALLSLLKGLKPSDRSLVASMLANPKEGTVEEACRAGRLLYQRLGELPPPVHATLARALVTPS